tara:strand:+ start:2922 stop:3077 length:156 start_codon:yes stop_codon:yes gene_type:complete
MKKGFGILLIIVGLLLLLNNLKVLDVSLMEIIRVYWPVVLIWLGVDKLLKK